MNRKSFLSSLGGVAAACVFRHAGIATAFECGGVPAEPVGGWPSEHGVVVGFDPAFVKDVSQVTIHKTVTDDFGVQHWVQVTNIEEFDQIMATAKWGIPANSL